MNAVQQTNFSNRAFLGSQNQPTYDKNPISKSGETQLLVKGAFIAGLGFGAKALFYLADDTTLLEDTYSASQKLVNKNKPNVKGYKKNLLHLGGWLAIIGASVVGFAALYTLFKAPEIKYKAKVNTFQKSNDMNVYIRGNAVETELYNQMNDAAKTANVSEKRELSKQYLKLKAAKNEMPDFVAQHASKR